MGISLFFPELESAGQGLEVLKRQFVYDVGRTAPLGSMEGPGRLPGRSSGGDQKRALSNLPS